MRKKFLIIALIIIVIITYIIFKLKLNYFQNDIYSINQNMSLVSTKTKEFDNIKDYINIYKGKDILFVSTKRILSNGDIIYFFKFNNNSNKIKNIDLTINLKDKILFKNEFDHLNISRNFSNTVGYDKITNPLLYIENNDNSMLISKDYNYNLLSNKYEKGISYIRELINEESSYICRNNKIIKKIQLEANSSVESFIYYSNKKLFNNKNSIKIYEQMLLDSSTAVWQSPEGRIIKIFYSIDPFTRDGYAINLANIFEKNAFRETDDSRIFKNFVESSVMSIMKYVPKNKDNLFLTEYTSTWVMKPYGIYAPYIDTRHNENLGLALRNYGLANKNKTLEKYYLNYSEFLLRIYNEKLYLKLEEGILFYDYYSGFGNFPTHASLNHQMAIINYLLESYIDTNNKEYKALADKMLNTIVNIGDKWIRNNGDLWYAVAINGELVEKDYDFVTLEDLIKTQLLLKKISKKNNYKIQKLIESKINYLKNNDIEINNDLLKRYNQTLS